MSGWLIVLTGLIYLYVSIEQFGKVIPVWVLLILDMPFLILAYIY